MSARRIGERVGRSCVLASLVLLLLSAAAPAVVPAGNWVLPLGAHAPVRASTGPVVAFSVPVGVAPAAIAYVGSEGELFVANSGSNNISVINDTLGTVVGSIPVGSHPSAILNVGNLVYVANRLSDNVTVINATTLRVVISIPVGGQPDGLADALYYGKLLVANAATNNVTVIDTHRNVPVASIAVGASPASVAGYPGFNSAYVANAGGTNVTPVNLNNNTANATSIPVGAVPSALVIASGEVDTGWQSNLYVANNGSDNVSVVNIDYGPTANRPIANVRVGSGPDALAFDPDNGRVYVANGISNNISAIDGRRHVLVSPALSVGQDPSAIAYDNAQGCLYIANRGSGNVSVACSLGLPTTHGSIPLVSPGGIAYDSSSGNLYVSTGNDTVAVINASTGRQAGPNITAGSSYPDWTQLVYDPANERIFATSYVDDAITVLNGSTNSTATTSISLGQGAYNAPVGLVYDPANGFLYVRLSGSYVTVINASSEKIVGSIYVGYEGSGAGIAYDSTNHEVYVERLNSAGDREEVLCLNGSTPTINGTSLFVCQPIPLQQDAGGMVFDPANGWLYVFEATGSQGGMGDLAIINGSSNTLLPTLIPVPDWGRQGIYDNDSGLMYWLGDWNLTPVDPVNNTALQSIGVGTLPSAIAFDSANGNLYVTNPNDNNLTVIYAHPPSAPLSSVAFTERGAAPGTIWGVMLGGSTEQSSSSTIRFSVPKGPYGYAIQTPSGYTSSRPIGHVIASGAPAQVPVSFAANSSNGGAGAGPPMRFQVTFFETGLPARNDWGIQLNGTTYASGGRPGISLNLTNGSYRYFIPATMGYAPIPASGMLTVAGSPKEVTVTFSPSARVGSVSPPPEPSNGTLMVFGTAAAITVLIAAIAVAALSRRKRPRSPSSPPPVK